jgi:hypothetical protein
VRKSHSDELFGRRKRLVWRPPRAKMAYKLRSFGANLPAIAWLRGPIATRKAVTAGFSAAVEFA